MNKMMTLRSRNTALFLLLSSLSQVDAFVAPTSIKQASLSTSQWKSVKRKNFMSTTDGNGVLEDNFEIDDLSDDSDIFASSSDPSFKESFDSTEPFFETPQYIENDDNADGVEAPMQINEQDLAKEIVLDAIAGTTPSDLMADQQIGAGVTSEQLPQNDFADSHTVEAILAVSQQAVESLEAKLPEEVSGSIPLIPTQDNEQERPALPLMQKSVEPKGQQAPAIVEEEDKLEAPSVQKIIQFAIPAIGVWLCSPLLSLIDTSAVGLLSGTAQQAALNPAVAVTDYAALLIAFLYTGATNLVASAQEKDRGVEGKPRTTAAFTTALQLSGYVGAALGSVLFVFARQLLTNLIGNDGISAEVFSAAMKYVRIRALGMPAAAIIGSAQASCLGMQDVKSPLYVLLAAAIINFFGDALFVRSAHPLIGGAAGAAWATVFSQYAAVLFFMRWLTKKAKAPVKTVNLTNAIMELTGGSKSKGEDRREDFKDAVKSMGKANPGKSLAMKIASVTSKLRRKSEKKKTSVPETRGFLAGKFRGRDLLKFPNGEKAKNYTPYVAPVTATQLGRVSSYVAMSHVVASVLGTSAMAAQQVIVSLFYCLTPVADSLSLTAQSFVPQLSEKPKSQQRAKAMGQTMSNFFRAGWIFSAAMVGAVLGIPLFSGLFTSDPGVIALINSVAPLLLGFFGVHGVLMASEGLLLAQKDLGFLGKMYGAFFFAVPYFMLRVKNAAIAGIPGVRLATVWKVFVGYQMIRTAGWVARTLQLQRKIDKDAEAEV